MRITSAGVAGSTERVVMFVKTYPTPSEAYGELVCTGGVRLSDRQWIRIYPYPFRLLARDRQFAKGDLLQAQLLRAHADPRPDSFKLYDTETVQIVPDGHWSIGRRLALAQETAVDSVHELQRLMLPADGSWGPSMRPVQVRVGSVRLSWQPAKPWGAKERKKLAKARVRKETGLFEEDRYYSDLQQIPYRFYLGFDDGGGQPHKILVLDWEVGRLYLRMVEKFGSADEALHNVKHKIEVDMYGRGSDGYVILGSIHFQYRRPDGLAVNGLLPDSLSRLGEARQALLF